MKLEYGLLGEAAPRDPHILVMTGNPSRLEGFAVPPGAMICLIESPIHSEKVVPLIFDKLSIKDGLWFKCACRQPGCTRKVHFKPKWTGWHDARKAAVAYPDLGTR